MEEKIFGYARVSTKEQNLDRQVNELKKYVKDERNLICEKKSGKDFARPEYQVLKRMMRRGDVLYIKSLDRLGRNKNGIKKELEYLREQGITVRILDLPTTMVDFGNTESRAQKVMMEMINNLLIEVLSTLAENERETIKERQAEGIAAAKKKGKHFGRVEVERPAEWDTVYKEWKSGNITAKTAMERLNLKRTTFYRLVKEYVQ